MCDLLDAVLEDLASDLGLVLPPAPTSDSPQFSYESPVKHRPTLLQPPSSTCSASHLTRPHPVTPSSSSSSSSSSVKRPLASLSPFASPSTPGSKRPRLSSAPSDFLSAPPSQVTPVKAEVDAVLSCLVRRSPRQHPEPSLPLSEQLAHTRRTSERQSSSCSASAPSPHPPSSPHLRLSATPSKPPFHQSPARMKQRPAYLTPQVNDEARLEAAVRRSGQSQRRFSDGARSSSRRFQDALLAAQTAQPRRDSSGEGETSMFPAVRVVEVAAPVSGAGSEWPAVSASSEAVSPSSAASPVEFDAAHLTVPGAWEEGGEPSMETKGKRRVTRSSARNGRQRLF